MIAKVSAERVNLFRGPRFEASQFATEPVIIFSAITIRAFKGLFTHSVLSTVERWEQKGDRLFALFMFDEGSLLVFLKGDPQFLLGIHNNWTIPGHRFINWLS